MKKIVIWILMMGLAAPRLFAQFCPTEKGVTLYYQTTDEETGETTRQKSYVKDVSYQFGTMVVRQVDYENVEDSFGLETVCFYDGGVNTHCVLLEESEIREAVYQEVLQKRLAITQDEAKERQILDKFMSFVSFDGALELPLTKFAVKGQKIPSSKFVYKLSFFKVKLALDGVYQGMEKVRVPAGVFDCLRVDYRYTVKIMGISRTSYEKAWFAEGVGCVKSLETDGEGAILSAKVLSEVSPAK